MQPSSLIFVVIVGIWAAFFVQYWVRRREHIATARSVDAFTSTMRVLEVRDPLPQVDVHERPRSYAVSPARPSRPQVTVKRAEAMRTVRDIEGRGEPRPPRSPEAFIQGSRRLFGGRPGLRRSLRRPARSTCGLAVLVGLAGTLVYAALSLTGVLLAWAPLVPLALAGLGLIGVRSHVARASRSVPLPERDQVPRGAGQTSGPSVDRDAPELTDATVPTPSWVVDRRDLVFDLDATAVSSPHGGAGTEHGAGDQVVPTVPAAAARVDEDDMPLTWDPVPVPRPTYTMKAQAMRVHPAPMPVAADWDDDVPEAFPARRVAAG